MLFSELIKVWLRIRKLANEQFLAIYVLPKADSLHLMTHLEDAIAHSLPSVR